MARIKCSELRTKKKEELTKQLEDLKTELGSLRVTIFFIVVLGSMMTGTALNKKC